MSPDEVRKKIDAEQDYTNGACAQLAVKTKSLYFAKYTLVG